MSVQSSAQTWEVVPCSPADETGVLELHRRAIGQPITHEFWHWKLRAQPSAVPNIWLALHDGVPICHYAAIPTRVLLPDGERNAMVSVNAMTDPAFRRRGVLSSVVHTAHEAWRTAGIPFTLGLPNEQWGSREQALGWQYLGILDWFTCALRPESLIARQTHMPFLSRGRLATDLWQKLLHHRAPPDPAVTVRFLQHATPDLDTLWRTVRGSLRHAVVRDSARIDWRYFREPHNPCRVLLAERETPHISGPGPTRRPIGFAAFRIHDSKAGRTATIADIFYQPEDIGGGRTLVRATLDALLDAGADSVSTLVIPGSPLAQLLGTMGFIWRRRPFRVTIVPFDANLSLNQLRDPAQWFLTGGDFDVI
jgi:hypothetical protein